MLLQNKDVTTIRTKTPTMICGDNSLECVVFNSDEE